ncbi:TPR repeat protein [Enhygromyxa salina]|uniref:TPR repeat protein n=1 Tax=Enhygromyxa salina TaxID=215803 RepID=A0A0C1ZBX2_9BACT|nr:CHAT domain-containing protein [Enhygromyxa salina]KIG15194.1 TPR repeat protein [Enhygromyxa salina]
MSTRWRSLIPALLGALWLSVPVAWAGPPSSASLASCRRAASQEPDTREAWGCFYDHARQAGDYAASAEALRASLAQAGELEPRARGYALLALANLVGELDTTAAVELYEQAVVELERGGDSLALTLTLLNLAHRQRVMGELERSAETLRAAERSAAAHGDPRWIATVAVERVRHTLRSSGDLGEAASMLGEVEPLLFPDGDYQSQVNWLSAAASVHRQLGQLDEARAAHERLIALTEGADDAYVEASARYNRLVVMLEQARARGDGSPSAELVAEVERALAVSVRGGNKWVAGPMRCIHADLLRAQGQLDAAEASARRCRDETRGLGDPRLAADGVLAVLDVLITKGPLSADEADEAEALLAEAWRHAEASGEAQVRYAVSVIEAELRWRTGPRERAIAASEAVLVTLEQLRLEQSDPLSRAEFQGSRALGYERYVDHLLLAAKGRDEAQLLAAAFEVGERFRARVLFESLDGSGREHATLSLAEVELASFQQLLGPREAALVYQLASARDFDDQRRGSWVMIVTRDAVRAVPLTEVDGLRGRIELYTELVERRDASIDEAAARLWSALLADALAELPAQIDSLALILDGVLHRLPFASLRSGPDAPTLAQRYATSVVPSARVLALWYRHEATTHETPKAVLALADPPPVGAPLPPKPAPARSTGTTPEIELGPLPFARREAKLVAHGDDDLVWVGAAASEAALVNAALERFSVLHLATHAIIDERHPGRSAIVLAPGDGNDGMLQAREIARLDLRGKLVVLSACSSARDRVVDGEGVMGLAHALFEAGAHVVVGGLWPLRDDEALALFERFYRHLDAGESVAAALAAAQRELAAAGAKPAAWAGVVVLGDGTFVPFPAGRSRPSDAAVTPDGEPGRGPMLGWILGALALLGVAVVGWRVAKPS